MPRVLSVYQRVLPNVQSKLGSLIDEFFSQRSSLWPTRRWPRDACVGELQVGAEGGHGGTRYKVVAYEPGRMLIFRFIAPKGYIGFHGYKVSYKDAQTALLAHFTMLNFSIYHWLMWHLAIKWVHEALILDGLDQAESYVSGLSIKARRWKWRVYLLRHLVGGGRLIKQYFGKLVFCGL